MNIHSLIRQNDLEALRALLTGKECKSCKSALNSSFSGRIKRLDWNARNEIGQTPFLLAVSQRSFKFVDELLNCPLININAQDYESEYTALHKVICCLLHLLLLVFVQWGFANRTNDSRQEI